MKRDGESAHGPDPTLALWLTPLTPALPVAHTWSLVNGGPRPQHIFFPVEASCLSPLGVEPMFWLRPLTFSSVPSASLMALALVSSPHRRELGPYLLLTQLPG